MDSFLGIDLGTSFVRGAVIDAGGAVLRTARHALPVSAGEGAGQMQDPHDWVRAVRQLLEELKPFDAFAIGGQMNGYVAADEHGVALTGGLTWLDRRLIATEPGAGGSTAPVVKLVSHLVEEEPEVWRRTRWLLLPKDYVLLRLTGRPWSDRLSWNSILEPSTSSIEFKADIPPDIRQRVPPLAEMTAVMSSELGEVVAGCPDGIAGMIGCGIDRDYAYLLSGTSQTVAAFADGPLPSNGIRAAVPLGHSWLHVGPSSVGGTTMRWAAEALGFGDIAELVDSAAHADWRRAPFFAPYLVGERAPLWDSTLTAGWAGVRSYHDRSALAYAVLESVVFSARRLLEAVLASAHAHVGGIRASGGGLRTPYMRQLAGRCLHAGLEIINGEVGALGAATLALAAACGMPLEDAATVLARESTTQPTMPDHALDARYAQWSSLRVAEQM